MFTTQSRKKIGSVSEIRRGVSARKELGGLVLLRSCLVETEKGKRSCHLGERAGKGGSARRGGEEAEERETGRRPTRTGGSAQATDLERKKLQHKARRRKVSYSRFESKLRRVSSRVSSPPPTFPPSSELTEHATQLSSTQPPLASFSLPSSPPASKDQDYINRLLSLLTRSLARKLPIVNNLLLLPANRIKSTSDGEEEQKVPPASTTYQSFPSPQTSQSLSPPPSHRKPRTRTNSSRPW